ncbi:hypothetical protein BgAZ_300930 [Babesia gibsoni]|uniref:Uncharacterized protein n=1 Tax=Babesia gibsoni TaxID=33632 RepID=A0AAD8P8K4_BABGI|nr:hypothetical protein BgAZ_300930 [Babesia gibsoni]
MKLPAPLWRYWQAIWPVDYKADVQVNVSGDIRFRCDADKDIFDGTRWNEVVLHTRGNGLFMYQPDDGACVETAPPIMAWLLEHISMEIRPPTDFMTLPSVAGTSSSANGAILYLIDGEDNSTAFMAIYFSDQEACRVTQERFKRCSLMYLQSLQERDSAGIIGACETVHAIESLRYNHELLRQQKDMMRLDNTLLMSQYNANKQAFSESTEIQMVENAGLKAQLEKYLDHIEHLEDKMASMEKTIKELKVEKGRLLESLETLELEKVSRINDKIMAYKQNSTDRNSDDNDIAQLQSEIKTLKKEYAHTTAMYHNYKNEVLMEYQRLDDFLYHGDIYEMLIRWITCNDLKVQYYETCHLMSPEEHHHFGERIQYEQEEFRKCITLARASYINCRTHLFDEVIASLHLNKIDSNLSRRILTRELQRLTWVFQPESSDMDLSEPIWMSQENIDNLVEKMLYSNQDHTWYNRPSYSSALKPILTNDAASDSMLLTLKRQLYEAVKQNEKLKSQVASLEKMTGSKSHWNKIWTNSVE